jgi:hypothetical protein
VWTTFIGLTYSVVLDHKFQFNLLCHDSFRSWPTFMSYLCFINIWLRCARSSHIIYSFWTFLGISVNLEFTGRWHID